MKITAQEEYGLRCLLRLARAPDGVSLTIPEVAAAENLSPPYVAKLLTVLRQAGLIESVRGRTGGYRLARPSAAVHLGEVMRALGEPLFQDPEYCDRHAGPETSGPCIHHDACSLRSLWQTLEEWLRHILDQVTLDDLVRNDVPIMQRLRRELSPPLPPLLSLTPLARE